MPHCWRQLAKVSPSGGPPATSPAPAATGFGFGFGFGFGKGVPPAASPSPSRRGERDLERAGIFGHLLRHIIAACLNITAAGAVDREFFYI